MALINFSFNTPKPKVEKKTTTRKSSKTKTKKVEHFFIVEKDIEPVIIEKSDEYGANVIIDGNEIFAPVHHKCFSTKGEIKVYRKINGMFITHLRSSDDELREMPTFYLPFKPGIKVKANIVKDYDKYYIYIKKIYK